MTDNIFSFKDKIVELEREIYYIKKMMNNTDDYLNGHSERVGSFMKEVVTYIERNDKTIDIFKKGILEMVEHFNKVLPQMDERLKKLEAKDD